MLSELPEGTILKCIDTESNDIRTNVVSYRCPIVTRYVRENGDIITQVRVIRSNHSPAYMARVKDNGYSTPFDNFYFTPSEVFKIGETVEIYDTVIHRRIGVGTIMKLSPNKDAYVIAHDFALIGTPNKTYFYSLASRKLCNVQGSSLSFRKLPCLM